MNRDLTEHWNHLINKSDCKEQTSDFQHWLEWQILIEWTACLITKKTSVWCDGRLLEKNKTSSGSPARLRWYDQASHWWPDLWADWTLDLTNLAAWFDLIKWPKLHGWLNDYLKRNWMTGWLNYWISYAWTRWPELTGGVFRMFLSENILLQTAAWSVWFALLPETACKFNDLQCVWKQKFN